EMGLAMMGTGHARGDDRAQAAAEAAIQNPLLDDVNLAGAMGIRVNSTAGPDFTMAEFDEVGRTVENFASEDATIVIGTVLDPDMQDEVRVTVVATCLHRGAARQGSPRSDFGQEPARRPNVQLVHARARRDGTAGLAIDDAVAGRAQAPSTAASLRGTGGAEAAAKPAVADFGADSSYLDVPAFLRRQAD